MYRTHTCWQLTAQNKGENIILSWWVNKIRNLWWMTFIDLRDRYGITQITINPEEGEIDLQDMNKLEDIKVEYTLQVEGTVIARPENMINKEMITGEIEIKANKIKVLTKSKVLPFPIVDEPNTSEENRFKYRYLDLRRRKILENVLFRSQMTTFTRNWFTKNWFIDVQTPDFYCFITRRSKRFSYPF
jgi:aspartyl-tRNA synthetase